MEMRSRLSGKRAYLTLLSISITATLIWSLSSSALFDIWLAELLAIPVALGVWLLFAGWQEVKMSTSITLTVVALMIVIHLIGARYSYESVPLFNYLRDKFLLSRNHYDRVAHFIQGAMIALIARESILRQNNLSSKLRLFVNVCVVVLGFAAACEIFEWITVLSVLGPESGAGYLGEQGDPWDTQKDMFLAFCGALFAQLFLASLQNKQIRAAELSQLQTKR